MLKKATTALVGLTGATALGTGTATAAKDHTAKVVAESGSASYSFEVSDTDPTPENFESGDSITNYSTYSVVEGSVDATFNPKYDKVHYNGSLSNIETSGGGIAIYVDGNRVYSA